MDSWRSDLAFKPRLVAPEVHVLSSYRTLYKDFLIICLLNYARFVACLHLTLVNNNRFIVSIYLKMS